MLNSAPVRVVVLISANVEWRCVRTFLPDMPINASPYGEWFSLSLPVNGKPCPCIFLHGGWGKISAAGSTQYAIDRWSPDLLINLGTCGGFSGDVIPGTILLVTQTLVYDIIEQMSDPLEALAHYTTNLDLSWLKGEPPQPVLRSLLLSADRDLVMEEVQRLRTQFGAVAGDWESGAIAYVAAHNGVRCLILRAVTDVVGPTSAEAYDGTLTLFTERTQDVMRILLEGLPDWLALAL